MRGGYFGRVDVEYAADGDSTRADEEGERMPHLHPLQINAPSNLEPSEKHSLFRRSTFLGPEHPPLILDGRWDQIQIGHGLDKGYAQGIMKHQPRHVEVAIICSCTECVALRHASDAVAHDPPAYNTGLGIVWENRPNFGRSVREHDARRVKGRKSRRHGR